MLMLYLGVRFKSVVVALSMVQQVVLHSSVQGMQDSLFAYFCVWSLMQVHASRTCESCRCQQFVTGTLGKVLLTRV